MLQRARSLAAATQRQGVRLACRYIQHFRDLAEAQGTGYQTMINAALRSAMTPPAELGKPITAAALRKVIREELSMLRKNEKPA